MVSSVLYTLTKYIPLMGMGKPEIQVASPLKEIAARAKSKRRDEDALIADGVANVEETSEGQGARTNKGEGAKVQGYKGHDAIPRLWVFQGH